MTAHESDTNAVLWTNSLDNGEYMCAVVRAEGTSYGGWLIVSDPMGEILHRQHVGIAYGGIFGPDIDDVDFWMGRCVEVIDNPERRSIQ